MSHFNITEHIVKSQHTRDQPASVSPASESNHLRLHVKQYTPKDAPSQPSHDAVTIIGAHANAFPKEMYEPFWDDLYERLRSSGTSVRGIWIADIAGQGQSGVLNEAMLGSNASWWDHGRDLLFLINQFQSEMPHPLVGIGHSVGGSHIAHLSLLHPRLLDGMILIDPIIQEDLDIHVQMARLSSVRRDTWPSRVEAASKFAASKFYQKWDPRALDLWTKYGLRDLPTEQGDTEGKTPVGLTTTKAQEVYLYLQANYRDEKSLKPDEEFAETEQPDGPPLHRPEMLELYRKLPELRPNVQYIFGAKSEVSGPKRRDDKMARTGVGAGGSGGAERGKVKAAVLDCGHLVPFEEPGACADESAAFISERFEAWKVNEMERRRVWSALEPKQRVGIDADWRRRLEKM